MLLITLFNVDLAGRGQSPTPHPQDLQEHGSVGGQGQAPELCGRFIGSGHLGIRCGQAQQ